MRQFETRVLDDGERLVAIHKTANRIADTIRWQARGLKQGEKIDILRALSYISGLTGCGVKAEEGEDE